MSQAEHINERSRGEAAPALPPPQGLGFVTVTGGFTTKAADWCRDSPAEEPLPARRWGGRGYSLAAGCHAQNGGCGVNACSREGISNKNLLAARGAAGEHPPLHAAAHLQLAGRRHPLPPRSITPCPPPSPASPGPGQERSGQKQWDFPPLCPAPISHPPHHQARSKMRVLGRPRALGCSQETKQK